MENALQKLSQLKRPKVLNTAVRLGLPQYKRQKELSRILGFKFEGSDKELIHYLFQIEAAINEQRLQHDPFYRMVYHIDVLIALIHEVQSENKQDSVDFAA